MPEILMDGWAATAVVLYNIVHACIITIAHNIVLVTVIPAHACMITGNTSS
jgi:hypothetical protein